MYPLDSKPYGHSYSEWNAKWWQWILSIPTNEQPIFDTNGKFCNKDQVGPVWFLATLLAQAEYGGLSTSKDSHIVRSCNIPAGKPLFFPIITSLRSNALYNYDESFMRQQNKDYIDKRNYLQVTIDGIALQNLQHYRVQSQLFNFELPAGGFENVLIAIGQSGQGVSDGYWVMLKTLPPGQHIINIRAGQEYNNENVVSDCNNGRIPANSVLCKITKPHREIHLDHDITYRLTIAPANDNTMADLLKGYLIHKDSHATPSQNSSNLLFTNDNKSSHGIGLFPPIEVKPGLESSLNDYTFLIYMIGSDLESRSFAATNDILEMEKVGSTPNTNIIVETGGGNNQSKIDGKRFIDFTTVQRHKILHNGFQTLANLGKQDMADPKTLSDFIVWGMSQFPAKKYAIILWDHGSGTNGFGKDLQFKNDVLNVSEMQNAFLEANKITHKKFEIIGFDACLMSSIEIADRIQPFGQYMISSEEIEPSWGWNYTAILGSLAKLPLEDGYMLGKVAANSYSNTSQTIASSEKYGADKQITLSVIHLTRVPQLAQAMGDLSDYLGDKVTDIGSPVKLANANQLSERYGLFVNGSSGLVDLYDLTSKIVQKFPQSENLVNAVQSALNYTIVYKINGTAKPNAHGLSIYFPIQKEGFAHNIITSHDKWQNILHLYYNWVKSDKKPIGIRTYLDGSTIKGAVYGDDLATLTLNAYINSNKGPIIIAEDMDPSTITNFNGTLRYDSKDFQILNLCNEQKICIPASLKLDINSDRKFGLIPVDIKSSRFPDAVKASLIYDIDNKGNYIFLGYAPEANAEGTISKEVYSILPADKISTSFLIANNFNHLAHFGPINGTNNLKIQYKKYNHQYALNFHLCDYANNCSSSRNYNLVNSTSHNTTSSLKDSLSASIGLYVPYSVRMEDPRTVLQPSYGFTNHSHYETNSSDAKIPVNIYMNPLYGFKMQYYPDMWAPYNETFTIFGDPIAVQFVPSPHRIQKYASDQCVDNSLILPDNFKNRCDEYSLAYRNQTLLNKYGQISLTENDVPFQNDSVTMQTIGWSIIHLKEHLLFFKMLGLNVTNMGDHLALEAIYSYLNGQRKKVTEMQVYTIIGQRIYDVYFTSYSSNFRSLLPSVEKMTKSFAVNLTDDPNFFGHLPKEKKNNAKYNNIHV